MKTRSRMPIALICASLIFASCSTTGREKDSTEMAEDQNEKKFDNTEIEDDTEFAVSVADGGMLEVQLGQLAQTNAASQKVKMFGDMMVTDHTKVNEELQSLAALKNISLPVTLSDDSQETFDDLAAKTGKDFDDAYTDFMVRDHKKDLDKFRKEAEKGHDEDLRSWAAGKISTLEHHLQMAKRAEAVADSLKNL